MAGRVKRGAAIVTGAAHGTGRTVAVKLAEEGTDVLVNTRDPKTLDTVYEDVKRVAKGGEVTRFLTDVNYKGQMETMLDYAVAELGKANIVVNNVTASSPRSALQHTSDFQEENPWINLYSIYYTYTRAVGEMVKTGGKGKSD